MAQVDGRLAPPGLAEALATVAKQADAAPDLNGTLLRILHSAADTIPGVEYASLSIREDRKVRTVAATHPAAGVIDQLQYGTGQGPCLDAIETAHIFRTGDIRTDARWPAFAAAAADAGVVSMMAFHLRRPGRSVLGGLNLHSTRPDAFDADAEHIGSLFAAHATVALVGELDREQLLEAVATRDMIGTAKGILMQQHVLADDAAFEMLVAASQRSNVKVRDIAQWIITDANHQAGRQRERQRPRTPGTS